MTTKKQKRAQVATKRAVFDAETRRMGQEALLRSHDRDAQHRYDQEHKYNKTEANRLALGKINQGITNGN